MNVSTPNSATSPITISKPSSTAKNTAPVVFDSPHSGTTYPADFNFSAPLLSLRATEDTHVEALYANASDYGATLIAANFPRSYIDANRSLLDIDADVIDGVWNGPINVSEKTANGIGLIWRLINTGAPIYSRKLKVAEVQARIDNYYMPYHRAVKDALDNTHQQHGGVWHINCHSMPAISCAIDSEGPGIARADFVLGDRDGTTCSQEFTDFVATTLRNLSYSVKINDPYKGVELVRAYSNPALNRHSLQVEINSKLYMSELTRERNAGFAALEANIKKLIASITQYATIKIGK